MSVVFDSLWWWRAEFDGRVNPYQSPSTVVTGTDSATPAAPVARVGNLDPSVSLGNDIYTDFNLHADFASWVWPTDLTFEAGQLFPGGTSY